MGPDSSLRGRGADGGMRPFAFHADAVSDLDSGESHLYEVPFNKECLTFYQCSCCHCFHSYNRNIQKESGRTEAREGAARRGAEGPSGL